MLRADTVKQLPLEMIVKIFSFIPPNNLLTLDLVCKDTFNLFNTENFWKSILAEHFPDSLVALSKEKNVDYKIAYKDENNKENFPLLYSNITEAYPRFIQNLMSIKQKSATEKLLHHIANNERAYSFSLFSMFSNPKSRNSNTYKAANALRDVIFGLKDESILSKYSDILNGIDQFETASTLLPNIYIELVKVKLISEVKPKYKEEDLSAEELRPMRFSLY